MKDGLGAGSNSRACRELIELLPFLCPRRPFDCLEVGVLTTADSARKVVTGELNNTLCKFSFVAAIFPLDFELLDE